MERIYWFYFCLGRATRVSRAHPIQHIVHPHTETGLSAIILPTKLRHHLQSERCSFYPEDTDSMIMIG